LTFEASEDVIRAMRVLVTGAGGLLGFHAERALRAGGRHDVSGVVRSARGVATDVVTDLALAGADTLLEAARPDAIVHCAAHIPKSFSPEDSAESHAVNSRIDERVLAYARKYPATRVVYCSSTSVFGTCPDVVSEDTPAHPENAYAAGKLAAEEAFSALSNAPVILRINSPYSERQKTRTVLKIFMESAHAGRPLRFHGSGARTQDFVHADDVASAIVRAVEAPSASGVYVIASGSPISMLDLGRLAVASVRGSTSVVEASGQDDPQEAYRARFSVAKAARDLGFVPAVSLAEGLARWGLVLAANPDAAS
jgi:nucleoside-diphosphate-sugar epimerase